ncbi:large ribosomal subunit protein bL33m-like [Tubulanus polymorphus]|uniref:large ribosomal subunit protein bL33m-like n=1 Tax=Tubulanus polymorphus TaxID=672921 RepID=UPI003DA49141
MLLTIPRLAKKKAGKAVMVVLESMSGTGHKLIRVRPRLADKMEEINFDPWVQQEVLYKELKKIRTIRPKGS